MTPEEEKRAKAAAYKRRQREKKRLEAQTDTPSEPTAHPPVCEQLDLQASKEDMEALGKSFLQQNSPIFPMRPLNIDEIVATEMKRYESAHGNIPMTLWAILTELVRARC